LKIKIENLIDFDEIDSFVSFSFSVSVSFFFFFFFWLLGVEKSRFRRRDSFFQQNSLRNRFGLNVCIEIDKSQAMQCVLGSAQAARSRKIVRTHGNERNSNGNVYVVAVHDNRNGL
jgi:hypothetical protein